MKQQTEEPEKVTPEFFEIVGYSDYLVDTKGRILNKHTSDFLYIFEEDGERYVMLKVWDDGFMKDPTDMKSLKAMGIEIKRSDTALYIQKFLQNMLLQLLNGATESELRKLVSDFKKDFAKQKPWELASPKTVKKLSKWSTLVSSTDRLAISSGVSRSETFKPFAIASFSISLISIIVFFLSSRHGYIVIVFVGEPARTPQIN